MNDENTQNGTKPHETIGGPPILPIANGEANGASDDAPDDTPSNEQVDAQASAAAVPTDIKTEASASAQSPSQRKKKKKDRGQQRQPTPPAAAAPSVSSALAETPSFLEQFQSEDRQQSEPHAPITLVDLAVEQQGQAPIAEAVPIAEVGPIAEAAPIAEEPAAAAPPLEVPAEALRLRLKVWTDPATSVRYLMPLAQMRDVVNGQPVSDVMYAYGMRDGGDGTKLVTLTIREWNTLPFFYFQEDGPAPRATERPFDVAEGLRGKVP